MEEVISFDQRLLLALNGSESTYPTWTTSS